MPARFSPLLARYPALFPVIFSFFLAGCGVPGPPVPPTAKIPRPPTELAAQQVGERVLLRWTLPLLNTDGTRLEGRPRLEVFRAFLSDTTDLEARFAAEAHAAYVIPERVVESFLRNDIVVFPDVLGAALLEQQAGRTAVYGVKALNPKGQDAGFSNLAALRVYPVPTPIAALSTRVTERAIELRWEPPRRTSGGAPLEAIAGYHVYRSETGEEGSFSLRGLAPVARYDDTEFRFGARYFYRIRTVAQFGADTVESDSSAPVEVAARDLFPPPAPTQLIAVAGVERVDLTWDASPAGDLAGYNVYRSREPGRGYERLTRGLLRAQSFADTGLPAGTPFYYVVTAVDRDGNESPFSNEVSVTPLRPE